MDYQISTYNSLNMNYDFFVKIAKILDKLFDEVVSMENTVIEKVIEREEDGEFRCIENHWENLKTQYKPLFALVDDYFHQIKSVENVNELKFVNKLLIKPYQDRFDLIEEELNKLDEMGAEKDVRYNFLDRLFKFSDEIQMGYDLVKEELDDLIPKKTTKTELNVINLNFEIDQQNKLINLLFENLHPHLINCSQDIFKSHFQKEKFKLQIEKIQWLGTEPQIKHLFVWLKSNHIIIEKKVNIIISQHFKNSKGDNFKPSQLSVATSKIFFDDLELIPEITNNIKKLVRTFN